MDLEIFEMESVSFELLENPSVANKEMVWSGLDVGQNGEGESIKEDKSTGIEVLNHTTSPTSPKRISEDIEAGDEEDNIEGLV